MANKYRFFERIRFKFSLETFLIYKTAGAVSFAAQRYNCLFLTFPSEHVNVEI